MMQKLRSYRSGLGRAAAVVAGCVALAGQALGQGLAGAPAQDPVDQVINARDLGLDGVTGGIVVALDIPDVWEPVLLHVPTEHMKVVPIALEPISIRGENYQLIEQIEGGQYRAVDPGPETTFTGSIAGMEGSSVAASILGRRLLLAAFLPDGSRFYVQPLSDFIDGAHESLHVVYQGSETACEGTCGNTLEHEAHRMPGGYGDRGTCTATYCEALVATDADFEYFTAHGSSTIETQGRIAAVINVVNHQYQRDVQITHRIGSQIVRSTAADPYTSTVPGTRLDQFRAEWNANQTGISRDVAHLFTGVNLDGSVIGIAWLGVICASTTTGFGYGLSQSDFSSSFACVSDLTAHEMGHNWDANHCTSSCSSTMNPSITCTNTFVGSVGPNNIAEIDAHQGTRACLTGITITPANNMCTAATLITSYGTYLGSNVGASTDGAPHPCGASTSSSAVGRNDVWWRFSPPANGTVTIDTCGSAFDTVLSVHTDCPGTPGNQVACNDDTGTTNCPSNGLNSRVTFSGTAGFIYYIRVAGYSTNTGAIELNITGPANPTESVCSLAPLLTENVTVFGSLLGMANDGDATCGGTTGSNRDVWYRFTSPCNGTVIARTCGTHDFPAVDEGMDTVVSIHSACATDTSTQLSCSDDSSTSCTQSGLIRDSYTTAAMTAGQTVWIRVTHFGGNPPSALSWGNGYFRIVANFTESVTAPVINAIANATDTCGSSYTGPTPTVTQPTCMTGLTWSLVTAPAGMTINSATGVVSWPSTTIGVHTITIRATNSDGTDTESWSLTVDRLPPVISAIGNAAITCGAAYTGPTPTVTNPTCMNPVTWSLTSGPAGMTINAVTGVVSWPTPTSGVQVVNIRATNTEGFDEEAWSVTVSTLAPVINDIADQTIPCAPATYTGPTPTLTNPNCMNPVTWALTGNPAGMTINTSTGVVTWPNPTCGSHAVRITATNSAGSDSEIWTINISGAAPVITSQPASQNAFVGDTVNFIVGATGCPGVAYQWQRNNVNMVNGGNVSGANGPMLTLTNVQLGDAANYRCVVSNACGSRNSNQAVLTVSTPPNCDPDYNQDGNVDQDDVVYLINVVGGAPNPSNRDPDFNCDGNVDQDDINSLINVVGGGTCPC
jgi:hypothetical protein